MSSWFGKVILDWLLGKVTGLIGSLISWFQERTKRKEIVEENMSQAKIVEKIAAEIKQLQAEGKPVPEELKEKLRAESRKLIAYHID